MTSVLEKLGVLASAGKLRQIDLQLARLLADLGAGPELVLATALTSFELGRGHVCLPLPPSRCLDLSPDEEAWLLDALAPPSQWARLFADSVLVVPEAPRGEDQPAAVRDRPLGLWHSRLYLTRYQRYEASVASTLRELAARVSFPDLRAGLQRLFARNYPLIWQALETRRRQADFSPRAFLRNYLDLLADDELQAHGLAQTLDWAAIAQLLSSARDPAELSRLDTLLPDSHCCNDQRLAAATAAGRAFTLISGGPGTGKTTTVARLLALLVEQGIAAGKAPLIRLVAPTGKAAARLTESLGAALQALPLDEAVRAAMPTSAGTLHRLLGVVPGRLAFRHHADNPLHLDILVVDEASMVDLPMMARLLAALPAQARLILLGDKDQLASVEAGAVLGDICSAITLPRTRKHADWLAAQSGYAVAGEADGVALRKSWRFDASSGIGELARACNRGDAQALAAIWQQGFADIALQPWSEGGYETMLQQVAAGYAPYLQAMAAGHSRPEIFARFNGFQLLCALREGPFGVEGCNGRIERLLERQGLIAREHEWYAGRPVMVVQNDHAIGLYNGDLGLCLPDDDGKLRVWFEQPDGTLRALLPSRLPPHETVYAMTIHKSQGSEFAAVVMVLPDSFSPILTRELIYTGITRAKSRLDLYADGPLLAQSIRRKTERYSGLAERLVEDTI